MSHLKLIYNRIQKSQTKYKNIKHSEISDDAGVKIPSKKLNVFPENFKSSPKKKGLFLKMEIYKNIKVINNHFEKIKYMPAC